MLECLDSYWFFTNRDYFLSELCFGFGLQQSLNIFPLVFQIVMLFKCLNGHHVLCALHISILDIFWLSHFLIMCFVNILDFDLGNAVHVLIAPLSCEIRKVIIAFVLCNLQVAGSIELGVLHLELLHQGLGCGLRVAPHGVRLICFHSWRSFGRASHSWLIETRR